MLSFNFSFLLGPLVPFSSTFTAQIQTHLSSCNTKTSQETLCWEQTRNAPPFSKSPWVQHLNFFPQFGPISFLTFSLAYWFLVIQIDRQSHCFEDMYDYGAPLHDQVTPFLPCVLDFLRSHTQLVKRFLPRFFLTRYYRHHDVKHVDQSPQGTPDTNN